MKVFFDTTVFVATVLAEHPHHVSSLKVYSQANKRHSYCSAHSLAETYATVTRLPGKLRMSCDQVLLFLREVQTLVTVITLDENDYLATMADAANGGIGGGAIYDALIARCAVKAQADVLYTWNLNHFNRFGPEVARLVRTP